MGGKRLASILACTAVLACAAGTTLLQPASASPSASATTFTSSGHTPARTHRSSRHHHRSSARCSRKRAGKRARTRHARRAHTHARTKRCSPHRRHRHSGAHKHRKSGHGRKHHAQRKHHALRKHHAQHRRGFARKSGCADSTLTPTSENLDRVRAAILCLVNRERASAGERALSPVASLVAAAQRHTEEMAFGDFFDHVGPHGDTPLSRVRAAGYFSGTHGAYEIGENIAFGTGWLATPRSIVAGWMSSPGHRANILDGRFRDTGIGASAHPPASLSGGQHGAIYTQDFGVVG
jgi:uncharacterized protein YkwD